MRAVIAFCLLLCAGSAFGFTNEIAMRVNGLAGPPASASSEPQQALRANLSTTPAIVIPTPAVAFNTTSPPANVTQNVTALGGPEFKAVAGGDASNTAAGLVTQTASTLHSIPTTAIGDIVDFLTKQADLLSDAINTKIKRALDLTTSASSLTQQGITLHGSVLPQAAAALLSGTTDLKSLLATAQGVAAAALGAKVDGVVSSAKALVGLAGAVGADIKDTAGQAHLLLTTAIVEKLNVIDALLEKALSMLEAIKANKGPILSAKITLHQLPLKALSMAVQHLASAVANLDDLAKAAADAVLGRLSGKIGRIGSLLA